MSRVSKKVVTGVTQQAYEQALADYAQSHAMQQKLQAEMDIKMNEIREKYANKLTILQEGLSANFEVVKVYCEEHNELFEKKKSVDTQFGVLGFNTGTPKIAFLKGFQTAAVMAICNAKFPDYIRTKEELNKEKMLADRDRVNLADMGVQVVQDENFYIDLKKEDAN